MPVARSSLGKLVVIRISIIAWALAELPALFGAVFYYLTGDITLFVAGVGALVVSFVLYPVARRV